MPSVRDRRQRRGDSVEGARLRRRLATALAASLGAACALLVAAPPASAHAVLVGSTPASGQVLAAGHVPSQVELRFDEPVEAALGAIQVLDARGDRADTAAVHHPGGAGSRLSVGLRANLRTGSYLVLWRVVSSDSHPVHGSFAFSLGQPGPVTADRSAEGARSMAVALGAARFTGYAGLLLLVGAVMFFLLCLPAGWTDPDGRRLLVGGLAAATLAVGLSLVLQSAYDVDASWSRIWDVATLKAVLGTRFGHAHLVRLAALLAISGAVYPSRRPAAVRQGVIGASLLVAVASVAVEGHDGVSTAAIGVDVVHLAAAGTWLGGLVVLCAVLVRRARRAPVAVPRASGHVGGGVAVLAAPPPDAQPAVAWSAVRRFSALALASVTVLVASGVLQALRQVRELGALTGTNYGRLLLVKLGLVAAMLAAAAVSRFVVRTRSGSDTGVRILARSVAVETGLLVAVLAVTSVLVATTPARVAYRPVVERTVRAGPLSIQISAVPAGTHVLDLHLYAFGQDGLPTPVAAVRATAGGAVGDVSIPMLNVGTGHFVAERVLLPHSGTWQLILTVTVSDVDAYTTSTSLPVR